MNEFVIETAASAGDNTISRIILESAAVPYELQARLSASLGKVSADCIGPSIVIIDSSALDEKMIECLPGSAEQLSSWIVDAIKSVGDDRLIPVIVTRSKLLGVEIRNKIIDYRRDYLRNVFTPLRVDTVQEAESASEKYLAIYERELVKIRGEHSRQWREEEVEQLFQIVRTQRMISFFFGAICGSFLFAYLISLNKPDLKVLPTACYIFAMMLMLFVLSNRRRPARQANRPIPFVAFTVPRRQLLQINQTAYNILEHDYNPMR